MVIRDDTKQESGPVVTKMEVKTETTSGGAHAEEKATLAAIKLQSFVRASVCRARVSNMVKDLIDEMMAAKTAAASAVESQKKVDGKVVESDELPETSVHDLVSAMESPKSASKSKIAAPTDIVQEMHGSVRDRLAMFESPVKASPAKKKFWSRDNRGKELGDNHVGVHAETAAAASEIQSPDLSGSHARSLKDTKLETNSTRHVVSSQDLLHEHEARLEEEMQQLVKDIKRLGEPGTRACTFGQLFDDEKVANYYEALVGTLKAAKKKGRVKYEGQMLLKGVSDNVMISLV